MLRKVGALSLLVLVLVPSLTAASESTRLPDIIATPQNAVPACVTPGRLMAYLQSRNPQLDPRYDTIATQYMRQGEMMGLRWDYAFYQMIVETGALSYWRGHRAGDVKPAQNNFAGLGATGKGERGESFADIESGVRAHLEHLLLYAGRPVENPVAQRTRNVRDWGVLTAWHQTFTRPITFTDMSTRWAQSKTYAGMLKLVADRFHAEVCNGPDPRPGLLQEARAQSVKTPAAKTAAAKTPAAALPAAKGAEISEQRRPLGLELAQQAIEQAKAEGSDRRFGLGAQTPPAADLAPAAAPPSTPFKVLNAAPEETPTQISELPPAATAPPAANIKATISDAKAAAVAPSSSAKAAPAEKASTKTALAATAGKTKAIIETATPPAANQRCRVWTASYGGQKAILIRSIVDQVVNFTVLDVNDGSETREAEAFITAYARNGKIAGEYTSQAQALDKAFELCPEG